MGPSWLLWDLCQTVTPNLHAGMTLLSGRSTQGMCPRQVEQVSWTLADCSAS